MKKPYIILIFAIISLGICSTLQFILNKNTESKISDASHIIEHKSKSKDSLQTVVEASKNERIKFTSQLGSTAKLWKNLEYTLTFENARASVYYSLDQDFVEECKQLGYKDSESFFDYISEHSIENEKKRIKNIKTLNTEIDTIIKTKQTLQSEIIKFTSTLIWTVALTLGAMTFLFIIKAIRTSKN